MAQAEFIWTDRALHTLDAAGDGLVAPVTKKLQVLLLRPFAPNPVCLSDLGSMIWGFVPWPNIFRIPAEGGSRW